MRLKLLFIIGLGAGYVLGARAGRTRYEQIRAKLTGTWEDPRVQKVVTDTQVFVNENAPIVQEKVAAGTKAALAGTQDVAAHVSEIAKDVSKVTKEASESVAKNAKKASKIVAKTAKDALDRIIDRGEEVVGGVLIAAGVARDDALEGEFGKDD